MTKVLTAAVIAAALGMWVSAAHASTITIGDIGGYLAASLNGGHERDLAPAEPASLLLFGTRTPHNS